MKKKIAIFTTFYEVDSGFSLVSVAENQIQMLLDGGYDPIVLVQENFEGTEKQLWQENNIDIRPIVPRLGSYWKAYANMLKTVRADVIITHDLILQPDYEAHYKAISRHAKNNPDILWLNYVHSRPSSSHETPPGWVIFPNWTDIPNAKKYFQTEKIISNRASHSIDPLQLLPYSPLTVELVKRANLLDGDIIAIYPRGADPDKQVDKVIRLMSGVKQAGYQPKLLVVDWQSQGDRFQRYMDKMEVLVEDLDLIGDVYFTSRLHDDCSQGVPRQVVVELLHLSNVYIHASKHETYGLVPHEAMLQGNLVCLNWDWEPTKELFGDNAIYFDFGSANVERTYSPNHRTFWNHEARRLINEFNKNKALVAQTVARKEWTPQAMWRKFEELFYLET